MVEAPDVWPPPPSVPQEAVFPPQPQPVRPPLASRVAGFGSLVLSLLGVWLLAGVTVLSPPQSRYLPANVDAVMLNGTVALVMLAVSLVLGWLGRRSWAGRLGVSLAALFFCVYLVITTFLLPDIQNRQPAGT